jgi:hypothetical protein
MKVKVKVKQSLHRPGQAVGALRGSDIQNL